MKLHVYARYQLLDTALQPQDAALLLEGSWPAHARSELHHSLDESIDGRFDWIDRRAVELGELLGRTEPPNEEISFAYLDALRLRYYLVKLLRPVAYFTEVRPLRRGDHVELTAAAAERDYADLLGSICLKAGACYRVRWVRGRRNCRSTPPANRLWRRLAGRLAGLLGAPADRSGSPRVVLCGNPRLLDPVCRELLRRGCNLSWLYDRFAVRSWLKWQATGVRQLVCNSSLGRENRLALRLPRQLECRGVELALPVQHWLNQRVALCAPGHTRLVEQIDRHFRRVCPEALVLDQDATPLARAAVAVAGRHGIRSLVVQHGAPCCRFGFAPPVADRILVWGRSSQAQLLRWSVPPERIRITGAVGRERLSGGRVITRGLSRFSRRGLSRFSRRENGTVPLANPPACHLPQPPRILLLTTVPPRDERPDAVSLHLTGRSYAEMLRMAFETITGIDGAELIVKLHPRTRSDPVVRSLAAEFSAIRTRIVAGGDFRQWLGRVDCVLSCGSSAGVEATLAGAAVIQLAPRGANDFLPHDEWGMLGTARRHVELQRLLAGVLVAGRPAPRPRPDVFAHLGSSPAARIADEVLAPEPEFWKGTIPFSLRENRDSPQVV